MKSLDWSIIVKSNPWYLWTILSSAATLGLKLEKTSLGSALSSPLITMAFSLVLCNLGIIPSNSPVYSNINKYLVSLAIPLLLLDADLRKCFRNMGSMLKAFLIGSAGTILGTFVAYTLVPMKTVTDSKKVAVALCARHIGGAVNFIAVSDVLKIPSEVIAASIAADNVVVAIYFSILFAISSPDRKIYKLLDEDRNVSPEKPNALETFADSNENLLDRKSENTLEANDITIDKLASVISLSFILCLLSQVFSINIYKNLKST
jgi:uncharacterized membrane protein